MENRQYTRARGRYRQQHEAGLENTDSEDRIHVGKLEGKNTHSQRKSSNPENVRDRDDCVSSEHVHYTRTIHHKD